MGISLVGGGESMKLWKWFLKCPLLFFILASWAGLVGYTYSEGKIASALENDIVQNPVFTALLEPEMKLPNSVLDDLENTMGNASTDQPNTGTDDNQGEQPNTPSSSDKKADNHVKDAKDTTKPKDTKEEIRITKYKKYKKQQTNSQYYTDPGMKALTTEYPYKKVDKRYFDDAVFIGDSRTDGMRNYSGLDNATFFAKTGLNVYELLDDEFLTEPSTGKPVSVSYMLKHNHYGKIYFMIGINELGTGNTGTFQKAYERVLNKFRKWQPDAIIYMEAILPVSKNKSAGDPIFNNININDKNVAISQLADGKNIFYFDISEKLTDKKGNLRDDYTFDDVHMYAQYYNLWTDFLMEHGVVRKQAIK